MTTPNRWAVREAAEVTFFSLITGLAIVTLKTLKLTEVQTTGETVYARGGRGNAKLVGFSSNREAKVTIQDAIFDNAMLAILTGNAIVEGAKEIDRNYTAVVAASGTPLTYKITLPVTPNSIVSIAVAGTDGSLITPLSLSQSTPTVDVSYTISGAIVQFAADQLGDSVTVYYKANTDATAKTVKVTSNMFGGTFRMVADVLVRDLITKKDYYGQFIAKNAKIEDDFSFAFSPDGDPSVLDIPVEILKDPLSTDMWELVIFDEALIV